MKLLTALAFTALSAFAQPAQPQYFVAIGTGFNSYEIPHYSGTGSFGVRIGDGLYSVTSLDTSTKLDGKTRAAVATIRTGVQKVVYQSGPISLAAAGDLGAAVSDGSAKFAPSTGGAIVYDLPTKAPLSLYGNVRIMKNPDPNAPAGSVMPGFGFGLILRLK